MILVDIGNSRATFCEVGLDWRLAENALFNNDLKTNADAANSNLDEILARAGELLGAAKISHLPSRELICALGGGENVGEICGRFGGDLGALGQGERGDFDDFDDFSGSGVGGVGGEKFFFISVNCAFDGALSAAQKSSQNAPNSNLAWHGGTAARNLNGGTTNPSHAAQNSSGTAARNADFAARFCDISPLLKRAFAPLHSTYAGIGIDRVAACLGVRRGIVIDAGSAITIDVIGDKSPQNPAQNGRENPAQNGRENPAQNLAQPAQPAPKHSQNLAQNAGENSQNPARPAPQISPQIPPQIAHLGGAIMPGFVALQSAFAGISPRLALEYNESVRLDSLAQNTRDAMSFGALGAAAGLVALTLAHGAGDVVFTGGNGGILARAVAGELARRGRRAVVDELLVFRGMLRAILANS